MEIKTKLIANISLYMFVLATLFTSCDSSTVGDVPPPQSLDIFVRIETPDGVNIQPLYEFASDDPKVKNSVATDITAMFTSKTSGKVSVPCHWTYIKGDDDFPALHFGSSESNFGTEETFVIELKSEKRFGSDKTYVLELNTAVNPVGFSPVFSCTLNGKPIDYKVKSAFNYGNFFFTIRLEDAPTSK